MYPRADFAIERRRLPFSTRLAEEKTGGGGRDGEDGDLEGDET